MIDVTLEEFRTLLERVIGLSASPEDKIDGCIDMLTVFCWKLPKFYEQNHAKFTRDWRPRCTDFEHQGLRYSELEEYPGDERKIIWINPRQCVGRGWLFLDDRSEGHPKPYKLVGPLLGMVDKIPPIPAEKAGEFYYCGDGNHRIYAAYLLGRMVQAQVDGEYKGITPAPQNDPSKAT